MKRKSVGPDTGTDLVFVLGWGNRIHGETVEWLVDQFVDADYRVHVFELPDHIADFEREYLEPVSSFVETIDSYRFVGHSTGGLIGAYLDGPQTATYLSPWWGIHPSMRGWILDLLSAIPVSEPILPNRTVTSEAIGEHATETQLAEVPDRISPAFLDTIQRAQQSLPAIEDQAVVFCSLTDQIVSVDAIGEVASADQIILYDGGHELFSSACRDEYLDDLLAAVEDGKIGVRKGQ